MAPNRRAFGVNAGNEYLLNACIDQYSVAGNLLNFIGEQKKETAKATTKISQMKKQLDSKKEEITELKESISSFEVDREVETEEKMNELNDEIGDLKDMVNHLTAMEREKNDELQEVVRVLMAALGDKFTGDGGGSEIGIKNMGQIDCMPFYNALKKISVGTPMIKAAEQCSLWQEMVKDPNWHPFKIEFVGKNDEPRRVVNHTDRKLKKLRVEFGEEVYEAVITALKEMNEYNPSGRTIIQVFWNYKEDRKAKLGEVVDYAIQNMMNADDGEPKRRKKNGRKRDSGNGFSGSNVSRSTCLDSPHCSDGRRNSSGVRARKG